ncbi:hypothetical protein INR49_010117, partial [Caranx melampygus]
MQEIWNMKSHEQMFSFFFQVLLNDSFFFTCKVRSTPRPENPRSRTPYYQYGSRTLSPVDRSTSRIKTHSSLEVKKKDKPLPCDREEGISIQYTVVGEEQAVDVIYLVLSRGAIVMQGFKTVELQDNSVTEGTLTFQLEVSPETAPVIQVVTYAILPSGKLVTASADFNTKKCFNHQVSLDFSPSSAVPGDETTLQLTAQPNSLCGVSAVDQSVHLKEPGKTLTAEKIFDLLPVTKASALPHEVQDVTTCRRWGLYFFRHHDNTRDPFSVFQSVGLQVATNLLNKKSVCHRSGRRHHFEYHFQYSRINPLRRRPMPKSSGPLSFDLGLRSKSGVEPPPPPPPPVQTVRTFFPETWIWDLVDVGRGIFFSHAMSEVTVTPEPSLDYTLTPLSSDQYTSCLCGSERKTLRWMMVPSSLGDVNVTVSAEAVASQVLCGNELVNVPDRGRIDVVTRSLIVKAEGTELTKTHNWLLCPKGGFGLDQTFGPMTDTASERSGLQLTAFVMRCFAKAQSFTFIDPAKIQQSKTWLLSKQQTNGCFQKSGKLFNNRMKGGVSDEVTLSAYITASFLEMN